MTAPAAIPPFRKIPIFHVYPEGHHAAGKTVERGRLCVCGQRFFNQSLVNPEYLDALRGDQSKLFVDECCEIEKKDTPPGFRIWTPKRCFKCARREAAPVKQGDIYDNVEDRFR